MITIVEIGFLRRLGCVVCVVRARPWPSVARLWSVRAPRRPRRPAFYITDWSGTSAGTISTRPAPSDSPASACSPTPYA